MAKKDYQEFKLKLNMKTILLYEEMSGKSFYDVGGEDVMLLIYCALIVNNDLTITKAHFDTIMKNEKIARELMSKCQSELDFMQQFTSKVEDAETQELGGELLENTKISDIIHMLILQHNLDIHYVMYEMRLWEISPLVKTIGEKVKSEMVEKRFWTYMTICPHIDNKKVKGPESLLPFPWEKEDKKKNAIKFMEENKQGIMSFFNKDKKEENNG